ncbi:MAG: polysaccharide biosynthesis tyrosine autokinase [Vicinamibacterales bacterium]
MEHTDDASSTSARVAARENLSSTTARATRSGRDGFRDILRIITRRRMTAVVTALCLALPLAAFVWTQPPVYSATARVMVGPDDRPVRVGQATTAPPPVDLTTLQTEAQVVRSRAVLARTVDALKLQERPSALVLAPSGLGRLTALFKTPVLSGAGASDGAANRDVLADALMARVNVTLVPDTQLLDINVEASDPAFAAEAANAVAETYARQDVEARYQTVQENTTFLNERLAKQRAQVAASEAALQRYREQQNASSLQERQNMVVQRLGELNSAVTKAKTDRIAREEAYRQLSRIEDDPTALERAPVILENAFIQTLKSDLAALERQEKQDAEKLGDRHPDMVRLRSTIKEAGDRLNAETRKAVDAVKSAYEAAVAQEQSLTEALEAQKQEAQDLDRKAVEYSALDREAAGNRQLFDSVLQDSKQTGLVSDVKSAHVRMVDEARVPDTPIRPAKRSQLVLVLFGSLLGAVLAAVGMEQMDPRVRLPDEISGRLGLAFMGYVPCEADAENALKPGALSASAAEAFRRIRTNILLSRSEETADARVIAVTSAAPREGKTTTASNLAATLASTGLSVLIIDADMRQGRLAALFGCDGRNGLSEVLNGKATLADACVPSSVGHLTVLGVGQRPTNPAELLNSARFSELLDDARTMFDWVIVDTPPMLAVADASVVARLTDGVLFVVMADQTSADSALAALDELDRTRAVFVGGVLNRMNLTKHSYYYSRYYSPEYSKYYAQGESSSGRQN